MRNFADDYKFGIISEEELLSTIRTIDPTLYRNPDNFSPFDYINKANTVFVELKTRTNTKDKYPTTMIPYSKVRIAEGNKDTNKNYYFVFKFTDGIYYIQYNKELFETFPSHIGGRFDRGRAELNTYTYIPVDKLNPLVPVICVNGFL